MRQPLVLIVEDDPNVSDLLSDILTTLGHYEVMTMDSVFGAAGLIRRLEPAAILLDVGLPFRPGTDLLDELESDSRTADVPVIIISGMTESLSEERRARAAAVLTKPIDPALLLDTLRRISPGDPGQGNG